MTLPTDSEVDDALDWASSGHIHDGDIPCDGVCRALIVLGVALRASQEQLNQAQAELAGNVYTQGMVEQAEAEISILRLELKECRASIWKEAAKMVKSVTPFNTLDMVAEALESRAREEGK